MEFGRRLAQAGLIEEVNDVFHLMPDELQDGQGLDLKVLVKKRKAKIERFRHVNPPSKIGTMPPFEMEGDGSIMRAMFKGELAKTNNGQNEANMVKIRTA